MKIVRIIFVVIARFAMSLVFLAGAVSKIFHWHDSETMLHQILCEWQSNVGFSENAHECFGFVIPLTPILLLLSTIMELAGGFMLLLGVKEKLGATLLALFLIPTTIIMHQFWFVEGVMREQQLTHFLKNLAILGGLIVIVLQGIEAKTAKPFPKF